MYQFYYSESAGKQRPPYRHHIEELFHVTAIRPTMWEEHCLECSAPLCFHQCVHYKARVDGRCKRFADGITVRADEDGCCGQAAHLTFRRWGNLMTIIFPAMLTVQDNQTLMEKNQALGNRLHGIARSRLPVKAKWEAIRTVEYLRRRKLRKLKGQQNRPDAFVFHGYSYQKEAFQLILEIYDGQTPVFRSAMTLNPGENLCTIDRDALGQACWTNNYLVKLYPENDLEAELDILWCDFVQGQPVTQNSDPLPAQTVKCVVWDLDETLWDGILMETEHAETLQLKPGVLETMQELDRRGILQSIASKNDMENAWPVVEKLGVGGYFLYPQINWGAKSASMEQIATCLNIGIDALALIDDSVFEREQVRSVFPQIRTYDAKELEGLLSRSEFQTLVTEESKNRRAMYQAEEKRNAAQQTDQTDTVSFLKKCNLQVELFEPRTDAEKLRCYELLVRTNQLNMSGIKYTEEEFQTVLQRPDHRNIAFSCKDDFGTYGIVGFAQYRVEHQQVVFTEFAMSCRVAGKYVESALFAALLIREHCDEGVFCVQKTKKNGLLRRTLEEIGFLPIRQDVQTIEYSFDRFLINHDVVLVK